MMFRLDPVQASTTLTWDQWLEYLECQHPPQLALPRGLDLANPGDCQWLTDVIDALDRPGPSLPL